MDKKYLFKGAITELIAPFKENEEIDYDKFVQQIDFQLKAGIKGFFLSGLTECMILSLEEQVEMLRVTVETVKGAVPVMGNVATTRPKDALYLIQEFEKCGVDAISITQPYIFNYGEEAMYHYYTKLIHACKKPVYIYNAPQTNNILSPKLVHRLFKENNNVLGYKDSLIDIMHLQEVMAGIDKDRHVEVLGGSDVSTFALMSMGGCGIISWVSILYPQLVIDLCDTYLNGDIDKSRELQFMVNSVRSALKQAPMDTGYRHVGEIIGVPLGYARRPMTPFAQEDQKKLVTDRLKELGML